MRFHVPSFLLGYASGAATAVFWRHLRPLVLELATAVYRAADTIAARVAIKGEDFQDLLAEAKARARGRLGRAPAGQPTN